MWIRAPCWRAIAAVASLLGVSALSAVVDVRDHEGGVRTLTLNRPPANAFDAELIRELGEAARTAGTDDTDAASVGDACDDLPQFELHVSGLKRQLERIRGACVKRVLDLIEREETGQVVLTAPKESDVRVRRDSLPRWRIQAGSIST